MVKNGMRPAYPGEVLREDYLVPLGMSANALAIALKVPAPGSTINDIVSERRGITADTAMWLVRYSNVKSLALRARFKFRGYAL